MGKENADERGRNKIKDADVVLMDAADELIDAGQPSIHVEQPSFYPADRLIDVGQPSIYVEQPSYKAAGVKRKAGYMNDQEAFVFIKCYFHELFVQRDLSALDRHLHPRHHDDDIGDAEKDHIANSKRYLTALFEKRPTMNVEVHKAMIENNVISADLEWFYTEKGERKTWMRGVACFVLEGKQIIRRHTFIYQKPVGE
jgi:hypothetical protein